MNKKIIFLCVLFLILMFFLLGYSIVSDSDDFFHVSFSDWISILLTVLIGIWVAYYLVRRDNERERYKALMVDKITSFIALIEANLSIIELGYPDNGYEKKILRFFKLLNNDISLLEDSPLIKDDEKVKSLREKYNNIKIMATDSVLNLKKDEELRNKVLLQLGLLIKSLHSIQLGLFSI